MYDGEAEEGARYEKGLGEKREAESKDDDDEEEEEEENKLVLVMMKKGKEGGRQASKRHCLKSKRLRKRQGGLSWSLRSGEG